MRTDALLIGRRTYESFAGAWPNREGEFADKFNTMPKFVVSTTLKDPEWNNTTVLDSGDATAQVRKLKDEFDGELQVPGSHRLVQELIAADLVDQVNLMMFPVILGTGKRAFEETPERRKLRLTQSKVVGDGVVVLTYERASG
jgi:dihydrofolate reductase